MQKLKTSELNRLSETEFKQSRKNRICIVLDNIRSLHNVGSAFRTADAFLLEKICLCGVTGTPPSKEIEKTALGATSSVEWEYYKSTSDAISQLKEQGFTICAVEQTTESVMLQAVPASIAEPLAFVFGNEVYGVEDEVLKLSDHIIEIPQFGTKHSLNVSVSIGIILWEFIKRKL